jgi:UDP-N-acetylmuramoyl-L-alanyl-D-glutamate--2,6-diaminopimelate ligase
MRFSQLVAELASAESFGPDVDVSAICYDSRRAGPGALFVAVPGFRTDGHDHIGEAAARGAVAVAVQGDRPDKWRPVVERGLSAVVVADTRRPGRPAAAFHGHPGRRLRVVGVTGTNGKTTVVHLVSHLLEAAGHRCGLLRLSVQSGRPHLGQRIALHFARGA